MANTSVIRQAGKTYGFALTTTSYASTFIDDNTNDQVNYAAFLNVGANPCAVKVSSVSPCGAAVFPADGQSGDFVLPPLMETPIVLAVPTTPFYMTAIASTGTTTESTHEPQSEGRESPPADYLFALAHSSSGRLCLRYRVGNRHLFQSLCQYPFTSSSRSPGNPGSSDPLHRWTIFFP